MIFQPALVRKILAGRKTMTRRPVGPETSCSYKPGHTYALQPGRGRSRVGQLLIKDVRAERLEEITFTDAQAEGFRTRVDFLDYWRALYLSEVERRRIDILGRLVGLPRPVPAAALHPGITPRQSTAALNALARRGQATRDSGRWSATDSGHSALAGPMLGLDPDQPVWVIAFEVERDTPRLLSPAGRPRGDDLGHTDRRHDALPGAPILAGFGGPTFRTPDEPEAIDTTLLRPEWAEQAKARHAAASTREVRDRARTLGVRVREEALAVGRAGLDASPELDVIEQQLASLEAKRQAA